LDHRVDRSVACATAGLALLEHVVAGAPSLRAVADELGDLARATGAHRVVVAVDDPRLGRQVFCSGRRPLGDEGTGLWGPERVEIEPADRPRDPAAVATGERLLLGAVRTTLRLVAEGADGEHRSPAMPFDQSLRIAVARARRTGWSSTLVLAEPIEPDVDARCGRAALVPEMLRAGESATLLDSGELGLLLDQTASGAVPGVLARVARAAGLGDLAFGLAVCPVETHDVDEMMALARERLADARNRARVHRGSEPAE
jgi:hypothetical protein